MAITRSILTRLLHVSVTKISYEFITSLYTILDAQFRIAQIVALDISFEWNVNGEKEPNYVLI